MDRTATSQLGFNGGYTAGHDEESTSGMGTLERGNNFEIATLSCEKSQLANAILQEQRMPAYGRLLCKDGTACEPGSTTAVPRRSRLLVQHSCESLVSPGVLDRHEDYDRRVRDAGKRLRRSWEQSENPDTTPLHGLRDLRPRVGMRDVLKRFVADSVPMVSWFPALDHKTVKADVLAGLTVGVMVIPQSMSYASIAGLPYILGMYSACVPALIYAVFGQSRQLAVGPVAMVSLLVESGLRGKLSDDECKGWDNDKASAGLEQYEVCPDSYANLAMLTAACVGVMMIAARLMKLGFLVSFLGHPVVSGFTSGAAIIIGLSQVKYVLGFNVQKSELVYVTVGNLVSGVIDGQTKPVTFTLGLMFIVFLFVNKKVSQRIKKLAILGPLGPLVACAAGTLLLWLCEPLRTEYHVKTVGDIPRGIFPVSISRWVFADIPKVLPTAVSATLIGYMESIAIGKTLATKHGYEIDAGQELFALGLANFIGSMFSCYPVTGSFSRSAVNNNTGAVSQLSGLVTGVVMLCTLLFLTSAFYFLPQFVLAAIVINSVIPLVAVDEARKLWNVRKCDGVLWFVAFFGTLFLGVLVGIGIAVLLSLVIVIYESARPQIAVLWRTPGTTIYRPIKQETSGVFVPSVFIVRIGSSLYFANAAFVKDTLLTYARSLEEVNKTEYLVLEMTPVVSIDASALHVLHDVVNDFRARGIQVAFANIGNRVDKALQKAKFTEQVGEQWFFPTVHDAVQHCLHQQRAKKIAAHGCDAERASSTVLLGNECGLSNAAHHMYTTVYINLATEIPTAVSEITAVLQRAGIAVARAQVEPSTCGGVKHAYFVWKMSRDKADGCGKLTDMEILALRTDLELVIRQYGGLMPNAQHNLLGEAVSHGDAPTVGEELCVVSV